MRELAWRLGFANPAVAVELGAGLDDQFADGDIAVDASTGHDFQAMGGDVAGEFTTDEHALGLEFALDLPLLADRDLGVGSNRTFQAAVDVQGVAQGEVADKLCTCCNDGRSGALAAVRTTSVNDSH